MMTPEESRLMERLADALDGSVEWLDNIGKGLGIGYHVPVIEAMPNSVQGREAMRDLAAEARELVFTQRRYPDGEGSR